MTGAASRCSYSPQMDMLTFCVRSFRQKMSQLLLLHIYKSNWDKNRQKLRTYTPSFQVKNQQNRHSYASASENLRKQKFSILGLNRCEGFSFRPKPKTNEFACEIDLSRTVGLRI